MEIIYVIIVYGFSGRVWSEAVRGHETLLNSVWSEQVSKQAFEAGRVAVDMLIELDNAGGLVAAAPHRLGEGVVGQVMGAKEGIELLDRCADLAGRARRAVEHLARVEEE